MEHIKHALYFEAIIQLRPLNKELVNLIRRDAEKNKVVISKELTEAYGTDIYLSSKKFAMAIAKRFKKRFHAQIRVTKKVHTIDRQTSKELSRLTILIKLRESTDKHKRLKVIDKGSESHF